MSEPTAFGTALRALRESRGWSQCELGRRAGLSHGHISRIESGQRTPTIETIEALSHVLVLGDWEMTQLKRMAGIPPAWATNPHPLVGRVAAVLAISVHHPNRAFIGEVIETAVKRAELLAGSFS